jgi:hypothetical protein
VRRVRAAAGTGLFLVLAPGVVAGLVPWLLTRWRITGSPLWLQGIGWAVLGRWLLVAYASVFGLKAPFFVAILGYANCASGS